MQLLGTRQHRLIIDGKPLVDDHFSGIGHYTMSLLRALDEVLADEVDLDVRLTVPFDRMDMVSRHRFRRIRPLRLPISYLRFRHRMETGRLPKMDLLLGPAVYWFPHYIRWPLARSRSLTAVHDLSFEQVPETVDGPNAIYLQREVRKSVESSDLITALTKTMADEIAGFYGIDRQRVHVVSCAADRGHFYRRSDREIAAVKATHGVFGDYLITVGNIEPRKNQIRLVDAFCALPRALTERLTLVLVGAGAWNESLIEARVAQALASGYRVKLLLGSVPDDDLPALYSGARASVYASIYEGFGMPPLESMACRTPVACSNRSVLPEVVGDAAVLFDPLEPESMVAGLIDVLQLDGSSRAHLVEKGVANVDRYDWTDSARSLLGAVRSLEGA